MRNSRYSAEAIRDNRRTATFGSAFHEVKSHIRGLQHLFNGFPIIRTGRKAKADGNAGLLAIFLDALRNATGQAVRGIKASFGQITANSSPPYRAATSMLRHCFCNTLGDAA